MIVDERQSVKDALATAREELVRKIESGRVRDAEYESVRIKRARALAYVCNVELRAIEASTLEELSERLDRIEETNELLE